MHFENWLFFLVGLYIFGWAATGLTFKEHTSAWLIGCVFLWPLYWPWRGLKRWRRRHDYCGPSCESKRHFWNI